jgi:UDPglucose 6-dehydrogenase
MSRIAIIGTGYVGLTTGACFAHLGHEVICADVDADKVAQLSRGEIPIVELGLDRLVEEGLRSGRLRFVLGAANAVRDCDIAFLCVPTPQGEDGSADLSYIEAAAREISEHLPFESVVVNKSTVPVGSTRVVERVLDRPDVKVVSNPEFLREGSAVQDFLKPDRIVVGSTDQAAAIKVSSLYLGVAAPVIVTDPASAETIKYAANAFLATKLSFVNAVAAICEGVGADVNDVVLGLGYDKRIGQDFLRPGPGWGGSCFRGDETLLVRGVDGVGLIRFDELGEAMTDAGRWGLEALSWAPGSPRPEFQRVTAVSARPYSGEMVSIRTKMGRRLTVTADHPMVARSADGLPEIVLAAELTDRHWLPIALGDPVMVAAAEAESSVLDAIGPAGLDWSAVVLRLTPEQRAWARAADAALPATRRHEYRRSGTLRLTEAALMRLPLHGALMGTATNGTYVPTAIPLTEAAWEMIGLFLAEGHIGTDGQRRRVCWSFHPTEESHLADFVAEHWRALGVKTTVRAMSTALQVSVSSRLLAAWFETVLGTGTNAYDHRIPDLAWTATEDQRRALLRGLWAGDGSWSLIGGGPSVALEYGTVSRQLADGMVRMLGSFGIVARVKFGRTVKSTVETYWLVISGADQIDAALWLLEPHERDRVAASIACQSKRIAPTGCRLDGKGTAWVRVTDLSRSHYVLTVYSAEVEHRHTIVSSFGLVAHNCFPKDTRALLKIADDAGYEFELLDGVVAVNDEQFERVTGKVRAAVGGDLGDKTVAVWGLTFKAQTDDLRESPSLAIIERLVAAGATVKAHDPTVPGPKPGLPEGLTVCEDPYAACEGADVLVVLTEWDEYRWLDAGKVAATMNRRAVVDARNLLDRGEWRRAGFEYQGIGR